MSGPRFAAAIAEHATTGLVYAVSPTGDVCAFAARTWEIVHGWERFADWTQHLTYLDAEAASIKRKARS